MLQKLLHNALWIFGLLFGLIPFLCKHHYGSTELSPYLGENYMGSHILIFLGLATAGASLWAGLGLWLYLGDHKKHQAQLWAKIALGGLASIVLLGGFGILRDTAYLLVGFGWLVSIIAGAMRVSHHPSPSRAELQSLLIWLKRPRPWNGVFFGGLYALLVWHNYVLISGMIDLSPSHQLSLFINRIFTQLAFTAALYLAIQLATDTGPRWTRPWIWTFASIAPIAIIIDRMLHGYWNQTMLGFLNKLGSKGLLNFGTELRGGGVHLSAAAFAGIALGVILISCALTYGTARLARKWKFHTAPLWALLAIGIGFSVSTIEQAVGKSWKSRRSWMKEYMEFGLQLSPVRPPDGLAHFTATFRDHHWQESSETLPLKQRPDIYIIFVESFRHDALTPEVTPFLHAFAQHEAQEIGHTWAASNGTHLGWFGVFTSQAATAREASRDTLREQNWPGLPCFHQLKKAGYELQIHTAKNLAFRDMGCHFIGYDQSPFSHIREFADNDPQANLSYPEREVIVFDELRKTISQQPNGGHFTVTTIDSPHYQYAWHKDFNPPFPDYFPSPFFPSSPTKKETRLIKNQYFNALAWGDSLAKEFCDTLKSLGKYDDSIIVFVSDHGEEFQDHGGWLHVSSLEDEQVKVPMLIKWPKSYGRGPRIKEASHLDLMPSLLDYLSNGEGKFDTAGVSLLAKDHPRTSIVTTAQGGTTQEAMLLTRSGYKAFFTWPHYFDGRPGSELTLTRLVGPDGDIELTGNAAYYSALREHFPDAFERFFSHFEAAAESQ